MVRLISVTPEAEHLIAYCARVSSPDNQNNTETEQGLLDYCVRNGHWSIFEMANMVLEIQTSRAISTQILRHRSFSFQEFSQRYAEQDTFVPAEARSQDTKNRQNSIDNVSDEMKDWFFQAQLTQQRLARYNYYFALQQGIAKECARFLLPLSTATKLYMNGTVRSWIHYIQLRTGNGTQKEHMEVANQVKEVFCEQFPTISTTLSF